MIAQELDIDKGKYIKGTSKSYSFCYVDEQAKKVKKNFSGIVKLNDIVGILAMIILVIFKKVVQEVTGPQGIGFNLTASNCSD